MEWNYTVDESKGQVQALAGDYRVAIIGAEEGRTKTTNKPMITITLQPSGSTIKIKYFAVQGTEFFNKNMTEFFDSFGIERGNFNFPTWIGAMGGARLGADEQGYTKIKWFLKPIQTAKLPDWVGEKPERQTVTEIGAEDTDNDLPF